MRDRVDRAGLFARIAANADLRIDQVLPEHFDWNWRIHDGLSLRPVSPPDDSVRRDA
jgi:hypothetical protein